MDLRVLNIPQMCSLPRLLAASKINGFAAIISPSRPTN